MKTDDKDDTRDIGPKFVNKAYLILVPALGGRW